MSYYAKREAFNLIPETCPEVNKLFSMVESSLEDANNGIKVITTQFREVLTDTLSNLYDLEEDRDELNRQLQNALTEIEELKYEIRKLEQEVK